MRNNVPETYEDTLIIKKMIAQRKTTKIDPYKVYDPNEEKEMQFIAMIEADMAKPHVYISPEPIPPVPLTIKVIDGAIEVSQVILAITLANIIGGIFGFDADF